MNINPFVRFSMNDFVLPKWKVDRAIWDYELIFIKEGEMKILIRGETHIAKKGDIVFLRPHTHHVLTCSVRTEQPHVHFDFFEDELSRVIGVSLKRRNKMSELERTYFRKDNLSAIGFDMPTVIKVNNNYIINNILSEIIEEYAYKGEESNTLLKALMIEMIVNIKRNIKANNSNNHLLSKAMTMANRIVVMKGGYIQQIGTPKEIYNYPENVFVATFIGAPSMNIIESSYNNGVVKLSNGFEIPFNDNQIKIYKKYYADVMASIAKEIDRLEALIQERANDLKNLKYLKQKENIAYLKLDMNASLDNLKNTILVCKENTEYYETEKGQNEVKELTKKLSDLETKYASTLESETKKLDDIASEFDKKEAVRREALQSKCNNKHLDFEVENNKYINKRQKEWDARIDNDDEVSIYRLELKEAKEKMEKYEELLGSDKQKIIIGIRPEDIVQENAVSLVEHPSKIFEINTSIAELLGNEYYVHSDSFSKDVIAKISSASDVNTNDKLKVAINLDHVHYFDPISNNRIK